MSAATCQSPGRVPGVTVNSWVPIGSWSQNALNLRAIRASGTGIAAARAGRCRGRARDAANPPMPAAKRRRDREPRPCTMSPPPAAPRAKRRNLTEV